MGSILLPAKQEKALYRKIDDVRFDLRSASGKLGAGLLAISAGLGLLAIASIIKTAKGQ